MILYTNDNSAVNYRTTNNSIITVFECKIYLYSIIIAR